MEVEPRYVQRRCVPYPSLLSLAISQRLSPEHLQMQLKGGHEIIQFDQHVRIRDGLGTAARGNETLGASGLSIAVEIGRRRYSSLLECEWPRENERAFRCGAQRGSQTIAPAV